MRARFAEIATSLLDEDPRVAVVLADISEGLFERARQNHPDRVISLGIREQLLIGVTAGFALEGFRPIAHTYAPFLIERPFEQIKLDLGHQDVGAILVSIGGSYEATREGRTHHSPGDVALIGTLPGWTVHVPGHPDEMETLLREASSSEGRVYLRLTERHNRRPVAGPGFQLIRRGSQGTLIAVGPMLDSTLAACEGLDLTILYGKTVRPFDEETLLSTLVAPVVVLVEPYLAGTSAALISGALSHVPHRLLSLGVPPIESRRYGTTGDHDQMYGLDRNGLRASIHSFLDGSLLDAFDTG